MEVGANAETIVTGTGVLVVVAAAARKFFVQWMGEKPQIASHEAMTAQFRSLQDAIDSNRIDTAALRLELARMDRVIHAQQRTMTRMEMLLRQMSSHFKDIGRQIPKHMQDELDDLLKADAERSTE